MTLVLAEIPITIIQQISGYLDNKSLVSLYTTSKANKIIIDNNYIWKKKTIERIFKVIFL
jgi:hypothetical protein